MGVLVDSWCFCNGGGKSEKMKASIFTTKGPAMAYIGSSGTGFLIHRNLLLTTHAILPSVAAADDAAQIRLRNGVVACLFPHSLSITKNMFGTVSEEIEVPVPASEAWKVYGTLQLANIVVKELPHVICKVDVIEGDGGVGTVLKLTFPLGTVAKEKFVVVDDEKRVKVALVVEGGLLEHGFTFYQVRFDIIEKDETTCIIKATIEYEVKEEAAANVSFVSIQTFVTIMEAAAKYLTQQKNGQCSV